MELLLDVMPAQQNVVSFSGVCEGKERATFIDPIPCVLRPVLDLTCFSVY